jgi:hypothetical protein
MARTKQVYDPEPLKACLEALLAEHNESYREASIRSTLDHQALRRYVVLGQRPSRSSVLALADHFGANPNDLLVLAGYPPMEIFERTIVDPESLPSDIRPLLNDLQRIADPVLRRRLVDALRLLIAGYLEASPTPE